MGRYLGSWKIDDTLTWTVNTHDAATGALTDADSVPSYRVYEDETGTAILTGNMAKLDDANTTGHYSEQITLSAANGLEKGKSYNILVTATVDSITGGDSFGFQIEAEVDANVVSGAVAWNAAWDAEVQSEVADALAVYDPPTKAELDSAVSPLATAAGLATLDGKADDIKAKTDSLTFTVAGSVDANIQHVNDTEVTGDGSEGTEWGPAA